MDRAYDDSQEAVTLAFTELRDNDASGLKPSLTPAFQRLRVRSGTPSTSLKAVKQRVFSPSFSC